MYRLLTILCLLVMLLPYPCQARKWKTYENCSLVANKSNDGDSFHVRHNSREYIFRLYFVDCPETDESLKERITEQAEYWGISEKDTVRLGKEATKFTRRFLKKGFTVYTKRVDARGRSDKPRYYAMVSVGDDFLSEALVKNGLARRHGYPVDMPNGKDARTYHWRLKKAESHAKRNKMGGWGINSDEESHPILVNRPEPRPENIEERLMTLDKSIAVYSLKQPFRQVGILKRGAELTVLRVESPSMIRIRFTTKSGKTFEAQVRRTDLKM